MSTITPPTTSPLGTAVAADRLEPRDPDRLFPADPRTRDIARDLYEEVATAPIISPQGTCPRSGCGDTRSPIPRHCWSRTTTTSLGCCTPPGVD